jgi:glycosyltransferase involved in cell wall biosynthesis
LLGRLTPVQDQKNNKKKNIVARKRLRILEVSTSGTVGTADMGPVSTDICALANGFNQSGHQVTLADSTARAPRTLLDSRVKQLTVSEVKQTPGWLRRAPRLFQWTRRWWHATQFLKALRVQADLEKFDVVHVHDEFVAALLAARRDVHYVYTSHTSTWTLELDQGRKLSRGREWQARIERFAIRGSRATIGLGHYLSRHVPDAPVVTIPNGITLERWRPLDRARARKARGISEQEFLVLFVGRLHPVKGVDILLDAIGALAPKLPRLRAVIIGAPGGSFHSRGKPSRYAEGLRQQAHGLPVEFTGFVSNRSSVFQEYLAAADVAVFPSRLEPQGKVVLEALAMSVPVIASRTGGMAEIVTPDEGYLVEPEDPLALASTLNILYHGPERLAALRRNCRRRVQKKYTWNRIVERHLELFEKTLNGQRQSTAHPIEVAGRQATEGFAVAAGPVVNKRPMVVERL